MKAPKEMTAAERSQALIRFGHAGIKAIEEDGARVLKFGGDVIGTAGDCALIRAAQLKAYASWTAAYAAKHRGFVRGRCADATKRMVVEFPELRRVAGFAHWGQRDRHWWCVGPGGYIIDPTKDQFCGQRVTYEELDLNDPRDQARVPTGVCMNCGDDVYQGDHHCSEECSEQTIAYMEESLRS